MSMHKLTAGSGYDYLTRQVAALDSTEKGHTGLAAYYAERGEKPGVWIGSGMAGIDGITAGEPVTAEQMRALFGAGMHPLAEQRIQQLEGPYLTESDQLAVRPPRGHVTKKVPDLDTIPQLCCDPLVERPEQILGIARRQPSSYGAPENGARAHALCL